MNLFLDSLCNLGFKNIGQTPGIPKGCFQHPQDIVTIRQLWLKYHCNKIFLQPLDPHNEEHLNSPKSEKFKNSFVVRSKSSKKTQYFPLFNPKEEKYIFGEIEDNNEIPIPEIGICEEEYVNSKNSFRNSIDSKNLLESSEQNDLGSNIAVQKGRSVPERFFFMLAKKCPIGNRNLLFLMENFAI